MRTKMQKQRKTKYQIAQTEQISQILNKYLLEIIRLLQNTTQIAETEHKYQIAEDEIPKQLQRQNINTKL
jgi:siderophore synthetase component